MNETRDNDELSVDTGFESLAKAVRVSFHLLVVAMVCTVFFFLWRSFFVVESDEVGVILRFGRVLTKDGKAVLSNGHYLSFPEPIDEKIRLPAKQKSLTTKTDQFWYKPNKDGTTPALLVPGEHGYTLTGDMNIIHSKWTLNYTVTDPLTYATRFSDDATRERLLKLLLNQAVTRASTALTIDQVWLKREAFRREVRKNLNTEIEELGLGISIERLLFEPTPPRQVKDAFDLASKADQERPRLISKAEGDVQRQVSEAKMKAAQIIADANNQKAKKVAQVSADAEVFEKLYAQYKKNPSSFKQLYYEERMKGILGKLDDKFIIDRKRQRQIRIELNREARKKSVGTGN